MSQWPPAGCVPIPRLLILTPWAAWPFCAIPASLHLDAFAQRRHCGKCASAKLCETQRSEPWATLSMTTAAISCCVNPDPRLTAHRQVMRCITDVMEMWQNLSPGGFSQNRPQVCAVAAKHAESASSLRGGREIRQLNSARHEVSNIRSTLTRSLVRKQRRHE